MKNRRSLALILTGIMMLPFFTSAAEVDDGWKFELAPYFWGIGMDGTVGLAPLPSADIDMSFGDIWDNFESGIAAAGKVSKGPWLISGDFSYLDLSRSERMPGGQKVQFDQESYIIMLAAGYRFDFGKAGKAEILAGGRYKQFDTDLSIAGIGSRSGSHDWLDPLIGIDYSAPMTEKFSVEYLFNIGGFGVESDLEWEFYPRLKYAFTNNIAGMIGYRWMDTDYDNDGLEYNVTTSGWIAGLVFNW
jgi:opacity protein-like surface antigen